MIEIISEFLQNEKRENDFIDKLAGTYTLNDFVLVDMDIKSVLEDENTDGFESIYGCMYCCRGRYLNLDIDSVEHRLTNMYLDFLWNVLAMEDEKEKVRYILAFHYLGMLEQLAFQLTVSSGAPFHSWGEELSHIGKQLYDSYKEVREGRLRDLIPYVSEEGIRKYNRIFYQYRYSYHNAKHYSLLEYKLNRERIMGTEWEVEEGFIDMIDLFLFRYKAIFVTERLSAFMPTATREKVIESLVEV